MIGDIIFGVALRLLTFAAVLAVIVLAPIALMGWLFLANRERERIYRDRDKPFDFTGQAPESPLEAHHDGRRATPGDLHFKVPQFEPINGRPMTTLYETPEEREARHRRMQIGGGGIRAALNDAQGYEGT